MAARIAVVGNKLDMKSRIGASSGAHNANAASAADPAGSRTGYETILLNEAAAFRERATQGAVRE